jgi:hypothetical protein
MVPDSNSTRSLGGTSTSTRRFVQSSTFRMVDHVRTGNPGQLRAWDGTVIFSSVHGFLLCEDGVEGLADSRHCPGFQYVLCSARVSHSWRRSTSLHSILPVLPCCGASMIRVHTVCISAASKPDGMSSDPPASSPPALPALLTAAEGDEQRGEKVPSAASRPKQSDRMPAIQVRLHAWPTITHS